MFFGLGSFGVLQVWVSFQGFTHGFGFCYGLSYASVLGSLGFMI